MGALLEKNSFLWFITDSERLSSNARNFIADLSNELVLSVSSLWEIAIKTSLGKLELLRPVEQLMQEQIKENTIDVLAIEMSHLSKIIDLIAGEIYET